MDDLDRLLDEVEQLINGTDNKKLPRRLEVDKKETIQKCINPYLGPKKSVSNKKPCPGLRCIRCDFAVIEFPDARWKEGTDYIFLRTNMPHALKVAQQLEPCFGAMSYGCQCSHHTSSKLQPLLQLPALQWICQGHPAQKH